MTARLIGKLAGVFALTLGLAGCMDATVEVEVTSQTTAKAIMTQVLETSVYDMIKANAESNPEEKPFCDGGKITSSGETTTCVLTKEGPFNTLTFDESGEADESAMKITSVDAGLVRVSFPTKSMKNQIGASDAELDPDTKAMLASMFEGHNITMKVSGGEIVDTNMDIAGDKRSAQKVLPFLDLINGKVDLPDELYAVVRK